MRQSLDELLLLAYCMQAVFYQTVDLAFVAAFLCTLIYLTLDDCIAAPAGKFAASLLFAALTVFYPDFSLFFPVALYHMLAAEIYLPLAAAAAAGLYHLLHMFSHKPSYLAVLAAGCVVAAVLFLYTSSHRKLSLAFRRSRDQYAEQNLLLQEKNRELIAGQNSGIYAATLQERNRIAREIHDNVGHMLSRSILMTGALQAVNREDALAKPLSDLEDTLNQAMTSIRQSVHDLHDDSVNLEKALRELAADFTFCPVRLDYDMGYDIPRDVRYCFIAVAKEALNNVIRHSSATLVRVTAREHPGLYQLIVEDNGKPSKQLCADGMGIQNMRERVGALNGALQIRNQHGFRIFITIPKGGNEHESTHH